jgi:hypothetical protein
VTAPHSQPPPTKITARGLPLECRGRGYVLSWPPDDQEKVARFVREVEQRRADDDISEEEWEIIEARAARRDLATDKEVEQVFSRYRGA